MSKDHCAPASATAFTIEFEDSVDKNKKLGLKDGIRHFAPTNRLRQKTNNAGVKIDHQNNVTKIDNDDPGSDTGTYTIDDDDDPLDKSDVQQLVDENDVPKEQWVSQWASDAISINSRKSDEPSCSPVSSDNGTNSRNRRRLPATPSDGTATAKANTENYLQDTLSVMEAMEARIGNEEKTRAGGVKAKPKLTPQEERKLAWERRKNYDPLKASGKKPTYDDSYSDTTSEQDLQSSLRPSPREQPEVKVSSPRGLPSTKPNRAFALRKKLNSDSDRRPASSGGGQMSREDGGRFSMRTSSGISSPRGQMTTSLMKKSLVKKTKSSDVTASGGRSTSSLSSKEAEFQAWKRRKNYNPLLASGLKPAPNLTPTTAQTESSKQANKKSAKPSHPSTSPRVLDLDPSSNMQRSASFHYPDGLSRVHHNVYSSEDESPVDDFTSLGCNYYRSDIFEVNDDEFILPIGGCGGRPSRNAGRSGRAGPANSGRMEALDNLVISTIFSISTKLCLNSASLVRNAQRRATSEEQHSIMDTLLYVLEDTDPPASPSKKTSRELAGTLRNLKKVEQALQLIGRSDLTREDEIEEEEEEFEDDDEEEEEDHK